MINPGGVKRTVAARTKVHRAWRHMLLAEHDMLEMESLSSCIPITQKLLDGAKGETHESEAFIL